MINWLIESHRWWAAEQRHTAGYCWLVSPVTTLSRAKWLLCWYKHHHLPPHCKLSTWKHSAIWRRLSTILADSARQASIGSDVFVFKCRLFISSSLPCCWLYLESFKRPLLPLPIPGPGGDHGANWPLVVGVLGSVVWAGGNDWANGGHCQGNYSPFSVSSVLNPPYHHCLLLSSVVGVWILINNGYLNSIYSFSLLILSVSSFFTESTVNFSNFHVWLSLSVNFSLFFSDPFLPVDFIQDC